MTLKREAQVRCTSNRTRKRRVGKELQKWSLLLRSVGGEGEGGVDDQDQVQTLLKMGATVLTSVAVSPKTPGLNLALYLV